MCLTHWRRLECETGPDYDTLPPSRIGWFARQKAALFRENISGGDDSSLLFWRFPVLSWAKGRLKCTEEDHSLVTPSFFPATRITAGHISNPPTNRGVSCVWGKRSYWLCWEGVWEVRAVFISHCVHLDYFQQHLHGAR